MRSIFPASRLLVLACLASPAAASYMGSPFAWLLIFALAGIVLFVMPGLTLGAVLVARSGSWRALGWALPAGVVYGLLSLFLGMGGRLFPYVLAINACAGLAASLQVLLNAAPRKRPWLLLMTISAVVVPAAAAAYILYGLNQQK